MTKRHIVGIVAALMALVLIGGGVFVCLALFDKPRESVDEDQSFVIGWVSDPQWYSFKYFDILTSQNEWIVENVERLNMEYIIHTGDFVDNPHTISQWDSVSPEYEKWDEAGIPYGVLAGNHDVDGTDYTEFQQYFGSARYEENPWYGESYDNNRGHYDLMTMGGVDFIFVYLGYGDHTAEDIAWLNSVLAQHSDRIAMLAFHDYLIESGTRSEAGEAIFNAVVLPNPNVRMVFCGHNYNATRRVDDIDDNGDGVSDRTVFQLMANYQNLTNGGNGFFRLMTCDVQKGTIASVTYSPYLDEYNAYANSESNRDEYGYQDEFTIPFDFSAPTPKTESDPPSGTVIVNSRVAFAATDDKDAFNVPVNYLNVAQEGGVFQNAGVYDHTFSLTATDAFSSPRDLIYVVLRYTWEEGYHITKIVRGETLGEGEMVAIPQDGAVIVLANDAVDQNGRHVDPDEMEIGQVVTFNQIYGRAAPITTTFPVRVTFPWGETYGINGTNRPVGANQWVLIDGQVGDSAADTGDTHEWNMLFAFAPTEAAGQYTLVETSTASGTEKDLRIPEGGFVLSINTAAGKSSLRASFREWLSIGTVATLEGYEP